MEAFVDFVSKYLVPPLTRFGEEKHMKGIRNGIVVTIPFTIVGSIFLILAFLPIPGWSNIVEPFKSRLLVPVSVTFDVLSVIAVIGIGYNLAKEYGQDEVMGAIMSLVSFFILQVTPDYTLDTGYFGAKGLFTAIIVSVFCIEVQKFFVRRNIIIKMPENVPPAIAASFQGLLPLSFIIVVLWFVRVVLNFNLNDFINLIFRPLVFALNTLPGILFCQFIRALLWCVGIHGGAVLSPVIDPIFLQFLAENAKAFVAGQPIPYITATGFLDVFVFVGGGGATLGLVLFMLKSRDKGFRTLGRVSLPSALFEINEPVVFGVPIVLNPLMMVPYILASIILPLFTYILMALNIIGRPVAAVPWTMPPVINHYLVTGGDWRAAVWGIVEIFISMAIYYPFFRTMENQRLKEADYN
ncbi:MAG TPA: PTS sugar transporter subunit IIC [Thermoanaerobacterales bacterium]|nr:PTS sugar transporter subunit IIC [Thermoanaerobacterales bacterium]